MTTTAVQSNGVALAYAEALGQWGTLRGSTKMGKTVEARGFNVIQQPKKRHQQTMVAYVSSIS